MKIDSRSLECREGTVYGRAADGRKGQVMETMVWQTVKQDSLRKELLHNERRCSNQQHVSEVGVSEGTRQEEKRLMRWKRACGAVESEPHGLP